MLISHLLSVNLGFPGYRLRQHIPHKRTRMKLKKAGLAKSQAQVWVHCTREELFLAGGYTSEDKPLLPRKLGPQDETKLKSKA